MGAYETEERAFRRAAVLQQAGIWPGTVRHADGTCSLTFDPGTVLRGGL